MIYLPMSARVLTPGHIKVLKCLIKKDDIMIGLLTAKAMNGYKEETVPYKNRLYILQNLSVGVRVVAQNSLNPRDNLKKYKCSAIASGDGWEEEELSAINELGIKRIDIKLPGETKKQYSSSNIIK